jgi:quercetin dioxygenase-like cupin family protein
MPNHNLTPEERETMIAESVLKTLSTGAGANNPLEYANGRHHDKKVEADSSPTGEMGQKYLVAGKRVSMRLWIDEPGGKLKAATSRDYETVGYVISGRATLELEGQTLNLKAGDSWLIPAGAMHHYTILEPFTAV